MRVSGKKNRVPLRLFLPAVFILAVVVVMTGYIAWSTWQNLDRDRESAVQGLLREAAAIVHAVAIDVKYHIPDHNKTQNAFKRLVARMNERKDIVYVYGIDPANEIIHAPGEAAGLLDSEMDGTPDNLLTEGHRVVQDDRGGFILEIRRKSGAGNLWTAADGFQAGAGGAAEPAAPPSPHLARHGGGASGEKEMLLVLGLSMEMYEAARRRDIHHAGIMIGILLALGGGTLFFSLVIRNYIRDLGRMQRLQQQVHKNEKLAAMGRLSASVAHEIRNPLSSIQGFARFFVHRFKDHGEYREYASIMVSELDRINGVITDLITFAAPLKSDPRPVPPTALIHHILGLIEGDSRSKSISVSTEIDAHMPPFLVDENQMKQVLLNLLINALNVLGPGQQIRIGAAGKQTDSMGRLWVEDEGPGIPQTDHQRIFDPFYTKSSKGTGLGLAIVHKIVELHGGTITVESPLPAKPGGCRFTLFLPLVSRKEMP